MKYDEEEYDEIEEEVLLKNAQNHPSVGFWRGPTPPTIVLVLCFGIVFMNGGFDTAPQLLAEGLQIFDEASQIFDGTILSSLLPARGITGEWTGSYIIEENMKNPGWNAQGAAILNIKQNGNTITGTYNIENYRSGYITGTISSSQIKFTDGFVRFSGTYTNDLMKLNVESCSLNNYCLDPEKVGDTGSSSGVSYVYAGEPGIKGNIVLYKGSNNLMANTKSYSDIPDPYKPIGVYPEGYIP